MNKIILLPLFFFISLFSNAQDLIVTHDKDSILCRITQIENEYIYFTFEHKGEFRNTLISRDEVSSYQKGFKKQNKMPETSMIMYSQYPRWRFAFNGGFSRRTAIIPEGIPSEFNDYYDELKSGYHLAADFTYFTSEYLGLGLEYSRYQTSNIYTNLLLEDNYGNQRYVNMEDDITLSYIGPTITIRVLSNNKLNSFYGKGSVGFLKYFNDAELGNKFEISSKDVGLTWETGYDIALKEGILLGVKVSYFYGMVQEYEISAGSESQTVELEEDQYDNLSRWDFSIGFRFSR